MLCVSYLDYLFSKVVFLTIPSNPANQHLPLKSTSPSSRCGLGVWSINPMIEWMLEGAPLNLLGRDEEGGQRCGWEDGGLRWTGRGSWSQGGRNRSRSEKKSLPKWANTSLGRQTHPTTQASSGLTFQVPRTKTHFSGFLKELLKILCAFGFCKHILQKTEASHSPAVK